MSKLKLSVVITAHNNQDLITECIQSVDFADEVIVVDNESTDDTAKIAKKLGANVIPNKNNPKFLNESKNFGFSKAKHDWVLSLDTDERAEEDLAQEIQELLASGDPDHDGYLMPRHNIIFGKVIKHGLWYPDKQLRLFNKNKGKFPNVHNHELLEVDGSVGELSGHILHYNYNSISQYIQKIDRQYSDNEVDTFLDQNRQINWYDAIRFPMQDFLSNYFMRKAYKDGLHGLVLSILQAFYMFIVFAKIWERQGFKEEDVSLDDSQSEFNRVWKQILHWYAQESGSVIAKLKKLLV